MERAKIRNWLLVVLAALAVASMFPSFGGSDREPVAPAHRATLMAKHQGNRQAAANPHAPPVRTPP
jgi:hypothetical protein